MTTTPPPAVVTSTLDKFATREFYTVVIGGTILATLAGFINAVTMAGAYKVTVSHVTGHTTRMALSLVNGDTYTAGNVGCLALFYFLGSVTSGITIDSTRFQLGRSYGIALLVEAALLFVSWGLSHLSHPIYGAVAAAYACGLQNSFCTGYSGAVLRTTHMTGITTDIGIVVGQWISRNPRRETWKLKVFVPLYVGFFIGGLLGTKSVENIGIDAMLVPSAALCVTAVFYLTWGPAREAREVLAIAAKKVQTEIEMGISRTVDVVVDAVDIVKVHAPRLPMDKLPSLPNLTTLGVHATARVQPGFHRLDVQSPVGDTIGAQGGKAKGAAAKMARQVLRGQSIEQKIQQEFLRVELERAAEIANGNSDSQGNLPTAPPAFSLGEDDDDDEETSTRRAAGL
ncbi:hypothetical protein BC828DRAFT_366082 [Blastocladiella britannica]|nr:hypothetical protein BC828DRAFT_366082 [Blastocladiella britannica]